MFKVTSFCEQYSFIINVYLTSKEFSIQDWDRQNPTQIVTEMCGFVTILSGTFLLHKTKDMPDGGARLIMFTRCKF